MFIEADGLSLPIRPALAEQIDEAWRRLARPATWWNGAERVAIAAEVRRAPTCDLCRRRKEALSLYTVDGAHDTNGVLAPEAVEAIHRLKTDAGRITGKWVRSIADSPLGEERYVEIISLSAIVTAIDTFDRAMGLPLRALPEPVPGEPSRVRPAGAVRDIAWVTTLAPDKVAPGEINPFAVHGEKNIHRTVSLVPQEVFNFFDLDVELYLHDYEIRDFSIEPRAINHAQIELIAARASVINGCFY